MSELGENCRGALRISGRNCVGDPPQLGVSRSPILIRLREPHCERDQSFGVGGVVRAAGVGETCQWDVRVSRLFFFDLTYQ